MHIERARPIILALRVHAHLVAADVQLVQRQHGTPGRQDRVHVQLSRRNVGLDAEKDPHHLQDGAGRPCLRHVGHAVWDRDRELSAAQPREQLGHLDVLEAHDRGEKTVDDLPRFLDQSVALQPGGGHHAVVRPDGAALIRVRVVRGMVFGKSSHAPTTEHVGPHEPLTGEPAPTRIEDAHPKAVPGI